MQHAGRETAVLAPAAAADQPHREIGIVRPPADESLPAVHALEVGAPDREIAGAHAFPACVSSLRSGPSGSVISGVRRLISRAAAGRIRERPCLRLEPSCRHARVSAHASGCGCRTRTIRARRAADAPRRSRARDAIAVEEDAIAPRLLGSRGWKFPAPGSRCARARHGPAVRRGGPSTARPRGGRRRRPVIGRDHLEIAVGLARQPAQHRVERVRAVVDRNDHRDQHRSRRRPRTLFFAWRWKLSADILYLWPSGARSAPFKHVPDGAPDGTGGTARSRCSVARSARIKRCGRHHPTRDLSLARRGHRQARATRRSILDHAGARESSRSRRRAAEARADRPGMP